MMWTDVDNGLYNDLYKKSAMTRVAFRWLSDRTRRPALLNFVSSLKAILLLYSTYHFVTRVAIAL